MSDISIPIEVSANLRSENTVGLDLNGGLGATLGGGLGFSLGGQVGANLNGDLTIDAGLDDIRIKELATVNTNSKVDLGLDNIRIQEFPPLQLELGFRPFRLHLPVNFKFCLEVLGVTLFKFSVCGEGMAVGEDNQPRETERCK